MFKYCADTCYRCEQCRQALVHENRLQTMVLSITQEMMSQAQAVDDLTEVTDAELALAP